MPCIGDDADHEEGKHLQRANAAADGIAPLPITARCRFVDNDDTFCLFVVALVKKPAVEQRRSHRAEVIRTDYANAICVPTVGGNRGLPFYRKGREIPISTAYR